MNKMTGAISSFIHYDMAIINTIEYATKKEKYDVEAYKMRKQIISGDIVGNTPLRVCLDNSGESGKKFRELVNDLVSTVYSDDSTIVKLSQDGSELRVDYSQAITVFEKIIPIHENLKAIVQSHMITANKDKIMDEEKMNEYLSKFEHYYRGVMYMLLMREFDHQFNEYCKARNEAKGAETPQSNFIQNDINRLAKLLETTRANSPVISTDYYELVDPIFRLFEITCGRRQMPEGQNYQTLFTGVHTLAVDKVKKWEADWFPCYEDLRTRMFAFYKEQQEKGKEVKA